MISFLNRILGARPASALSQPPRQRLSSQQVPAAVYAIGDVHGRADLLFRLLETIKADTDTVAGETWLVLLGDYVDRGPKTASILDWLSRPLDGKLRRIALCGNHEDMMLDFLREPSFESAWLEFGGIETLASYGLYLDSLPVKSARTLADAVASHIPADHIRLLQNLPISLSIPGYVFAHAGIRPGVPMDEQTDYDLTWIRQGFLDADWTDGPTVVHGHTPVEAPFVSAQRIGIDTGAYATGVLTAAKIVPGEHPIFIDTR